ncbi:hypothetical protein C8Q72DRAFT_50544 [Fomitopsis betulina]|nr:hypothetical protein C8Q72DRAFT_50544 [Fomitopsis betulina]
MRSLRSATNRSPSRSEKSKSVRSSIIASSSSSGSVSESSALVCFSPGLATELLVRGCLPLSSGVSATLGSCEDSEESASSRTTSTNGIINPFVKSQDEYRPKIARRSPRAHMRGLHCQDHAPSVRTCYTAPVRGPSGIRSSCRLTGALTPSSFAKSSSTKRVKSKSDSLVLSEIQLEAFEVIG